MKKNIYLAVIIILLSLLTNTVNYRQNSSCRIVLEEVAAALPNE